MEVSHFIRNTLRVGVERWNDEGSSGMFWIIKSVGEREGNNKLSTRSVPPMTAGLFLYVSISFVRRGLLEMAVYTGREDKLGGNLYIHRGLGEQAKDTHPDAKDRIPWEERFWR